MLIEYLPLTESQILAAFEEILAITRDGAEFKTSLEVRFDSQGGDHMLTKQSEITKWAELITKEINE